jgi:hypothetical protein
MAPLGGLFTRAFQQNFRKNRSYLSLLFFPGVLRKSMETLIFFFRWTQTCVSRLFLFFQPWLHSSWFQQNTSKCTIALGKLAFHLDHFLQTRSLYGPINNIPTSLCISLPIFSLLSCAHNYIATSANQSEQANQT